MNQIVSWICLISLCLLCLQVMIYICEETLKSYNSEMVKRKSKKRKQATATHTYDYKEKIAK